MAVFYLSEKDHSSNRNFEKFKFYNFPTLLFVTTSLLTSSFVCIGGFDCANPGNGSLQGFYV